MKIRVDEGVMGSNWNQLSSAGTDIREGEGGMMGGGGPVLRGQWQLGDFCLTPNVLHRN